MIAINLDMGIMKAMPTMTNMLGSTTKPCTRKQKGGRILRRSPCLVGECDISHAVRPLHDGKEAAHTSFAGGLRDVKTWAAKAGQFPWPSWTGLGIWGGGMLGRLSFGAAVINTIHCIVTH